LRTRSTATCRFCESQADGLDRLCTPCRAESACTGLSDDLTDALENFLDARWSPHQFGLPPPAYYLDAPAFGGDSFVHDAEIITPFKPQQKNREAKASKLKLGRAFHYVGLDQGSQNL
jgi:hypothetical protein